MSLTVKNSLRFRSANDFVRLGLIAATMVALSGCGTYDRRPVEAARVSKIESSIGLRSYSLTREEEDKILALDPFKVRDAEVRTILSNAPAPRIINIHGGMYPVHRRMIGFSKFLIGMGYPEASIRNPGDGTWTFSCYEDMDRLAGIIAWYYEKEGMRPMMVGHSQGGMQNIRVLNKFAHGSPTSLKVWSPLTWKSERRHEIIDPLTGKPRTVAGLTLPYVASMGAGGLTRVLPNQWDMNFKLRTVPDTVEEFTGFYKNNDLLGGDYLGFGPANHFHASSTAAVRNVRLPTKDRHDQTPDGQHLLQSRRIVEWIDRYTPVPTPNEDIQEQFDSESKHLLFCADVWYSIRKHWVIELQRLIRARRNLGEGRVIPP